MIGMFAAQALTFFKAHIHRFPQTKQDVHGIYCGRNQSGIGHYDREYPHVPTEGCQNTRYSGIHSLCASQQVKLDSIITPFRKRELHYCLWDSSIAPVFDGQGYVQREGLDGNQFDFTKGNRSVGRRHS